MYNLKLYELVKSNLTLNFCLLATMIFLSNNSLAFNPDNEKEAGTETKIKYYRLDTVVSDCGKSDLYDNCISSIEETLGYELAENIEPERMKLLEPARYLSQILPERNFSFEDFCFVKVGSIDIDIMDNNISIFEIAFQDNIDTLNLLVPFDEHFVFGRKGYYLGKLYKIGNSIVFISSSIDFKLPDKTEADNAKENSMDTTLSVMHIGNDDKTSKIVVKKSNKAFQCLMKCEQILEPTNVGR